MEAKFIVIEGIDGTGTTTQSSRLRDALVAHGERSILTSEPTGGPIGSVIRLALGGRLSLCRATGAPPAAEESLYALLFATDRLDHLLNEINPALDAGIHVVTDRYCLSSYAYQSTGCDLAWLRQLNARARTPDITLLFDADPAVCLERIAKERHQRERYEKLEDLRAIRENYLRIAEILRAEGERIVHIDATRPIEAIHEEILGHVLSLGD
jgi:dTMP kinase